MLALDLTPRERLKLETADGEIFIDLQKVHGKKARVALELPETVRAIRLPREQRRGAAGLGLGAQQKKHPESPPAAPVCPVPALPLALGPTPEAALSDPVIP